MNSKLLKVSLCRSMLAALAMTAVVWSASVARADVLIDDFSNPAVAATFSGPAAVVNPVLGPHSGAGILGTRTVSVTNTGGALMGGDFLSIGAGSFDVFSGADAYTTTLDYVFASTDLSGDGLLIDFILADGGVPTVTEMDITITTATGNLTTSQLVPDGTNFQFLVPYGAFSGTGDITQATGLSFVFNASDNAAVDFQLSNISVPQIIPEPASLAVWSLMGLVGIGLRRRRHSTAV